MVAAAAAAAGQLRANPQSLLTGALTIVVVVVVAAGYKLMLKAVEAIVGAAAGAAAGIYVSQFFWEEEERTGVVAKTVIAVSGGIAGTAASMLRSMVATHSLIGSAIVGALAGAAIVALAKGLLQGVTNVIKHSIPVVRTIQVCTVANLLGWAKDAAKWVIEKPKSGMNQLKQTDTKIKELAEGIIEAAKTIFCSSNGRTRFGAVAALAGSVALAPGVVSGLASIATAIATTIARLAAIGIAATAVLAISGMIQRPQLQAQVEKLASLANSMSVLQFCFLLLFLYLFLWLLLGSRQESK